MSSLASEIPAALMSADRKASVIEWIRDLHVPARFKRRLLQDWGAAVNVDLSGPDYEAVTAKAGQ
jgi:hypothetical protein